MGGNYRWMKADRAGNDCAGWFCHAI